MDKFILKIIRLNPAYSPFFSGIFISTSTNIIAGIVMAEGTTEKYPVLLTSSLLMFVSGFFFMLFAWKHGPIHAASLSKSDEEVLGHLGAMKSKKRCLYLTLISSLILALFCGIGGIVVLLLCLPTQTSVLIAPRSRQQRHRSG